MLKPKTWYIDRMTMPDFTLGMLSLGRPIETLLVGAFFEEGRGAQRDIELDFHHDGVYSRKVAEQQGSEYIVAAVDFIGFYCVRGSKTITALKNIKTGVCDRVQLVTGDALIVNNRKVQHARIGQLNDRVLFRIWIAAH